MFWPARKGDATDDVRYLADASHVIPSVVEGSLIKGKALSVCSFLLTSEEKEPKKTATSKASFKGGCNRSYSSLFH